MNVPYTSVLNYDRSFKSAEEIIESMHEHLIEEPTKQDMVVSCKQGVAACVLLVALNEIGNKSVKVYDGSYEEFESKPLGYWS